MFDIQNYASFIAAVLVFQLVPGPGTLAILHATARDGVGAGLAAVGGTLLGDAIYMIGAVLGLAALLHAWPTAFGALQWLGIAYLCWIGLRLLRASMAGTDGATTPPQGRGRYFRQACLVSLTNPKVIVFFMAFFPLFLRPGAGALTLAALIVHVTVLSLLYQAMLVFLGNAVARRLATLPAARRLGARLAGAALIAFGVKLALGSR